MRSSLLPLLPLLVLVLADYSGLRRHHGRSSRRLRSGRFGARGRRRWRAALVSGLAGLAGHVDDRRACTLAGCIWLKPCRPRAHRLRAAFCRAAMWRKSSRGGKSTCCRASRKRSPTLGRGTTLEARAGQVWLTGGDVNLAQDPTPATVILQLSGSAERDGELRPFEAKLTIAANRVSASGDVAGGSAICNERIVSPIPTSIRVQNGGALWLRIDPRRLFTTWISARSSRTVTCSCSRTIRAINRALTCTTI